MKRGKKYQDAVKAYDRAAQYDVADAIDIVKKNATAKFDETIELHLRTGCDGRHAEQQIRGAVVLPHGTGKTVKLGGAIVAGSSAAEIILMDVTPLSLGIETVGGVSTKIIDRNTTIPTRYSQIFTTAGSFQTSVDIKVLQGERQFARDNKLIGNFRLKGIKPAPAGVPQIEVTFDIDANGIVQVSAKDLGTGKHQEITITASSNLSDSEIEQAIREAQEYEATDGQRKAYIDARSEADTLVRQVENVMADKEKRKAMDSAQKKSVKSSLSYVKKLISRTKPGNVSEEQAAEIKHAADELRNAAAGLI